MEHAQKSAKNVAVKTTIVEDGQTVDVSGVSTKQLIFKKPNGTKVTKTASFLTDGTDGIIQYLTEAGFLDTVGIWSVQGYVVFPGGFDGNSDVMTFSVDRNL